MIYEAGWPTTAGIDFHLRVHQYTPNEQNMNDFITLEVTLTNTGQPDTDADGNVDGTDLAADAVAAVTRGETAPSIRVGLGGERFQGPDGGSRFNNSVDAFYSATAVWYEDFGKRSDGTTIPAIKTPNPNFFEPGTDTIVTRFVPLASPVRPDGDYKYASEDIGKEAIEQPVWEEGWNPTLVNNASPSDSDFYQAIGYAREWTFAEDNKTAIGPFGLDVGESVTFVYVAAAGFRFEGVRDAIDAAQWAWERGWDISAELPVPAAPDVQVSSTANGTALISWTNTDGIAGRSTDGYKIWRASQFQRRNFLDDGLRRSDRYHKQHEAGTDAFESEALLDPINPYFDGAEFAFTSEIQGTYQAEMWGTYELIAKFPSGTAPAAPGGSEYDFAFEDENAITGLTYWYYVSAYNEGAATGPQGPVDSHLESAMAVNVNGRNSPDAPLGMIGLDMPWGGTYPFAWNSPDFPEAGTLAFKNQGGPFTVQPPIAATADVPNLITVRPNPYKITGLNDNRTDASSHNINFLNTPANFTLTILDVSGQIVLQEEVSDAMNGSYTWDMFSKDGVEVASGLYIYHIEYEGNAVTGHFAILR